MNYENLTEQKLAAPLDSLDEFTVEELETRLEMQACVYRCAETDWQGNCTVGVVICP
jgi:hypothetical protein